MIGFRVYILVGFVGLYVCVGVCFFHVLGNSHV